jgi:hypothetical protein
MQPGHPPAVPSNLSHQTVSAVGCRVGAIAGCTFGTSSRNSLWLVGLNVGDTDGLADGAVVGV